MKRITASILSVLLMLSLVFSSSVFAAEKQSAWDSFKGLFTKNAEITELKADVGVEYRGHVENKGDFPLDGSWIQGPAELGTTGESLRLEGFWLQLTGDDIPADLNLEYRVHVQNVGWMDPVQNGDFAGTEGRGLRIEAIELELVDDDGIQSEDYSVRYTGHVQNRGDVPQNDPDAGMGQLYYEDGGRLGTVGSSLRLEAIEVWIVEKEADLTAYDELITEIMALDEDDYTTDSWDNLMQVWTDNAVTEADYQADVDAAVAAINAATDALVMTPRVSGVVASNAAELQVSFNMPLDSSSVFADTTAVENGDLIDGLVTFGGADLGNTANYFATLSADGKTITFRAKAVANKFATTTSVSTVVKVTDGVIKTTTGLYVPKYEELATLSDTVAPTVVSVVNQNATTMLLTFSEPINNAGTATFTLPDGTTSTATLSAVTASSAQGRQYTLALPAALGAGKTASVSIIGIGDFALNLVNPNPYTFSATKGQPDDIKPEVSAITQTGAKEFTVKFSAELQTTEAALLTQTTLTNQTAGATVVTKVVKSTTDPTLYTYTVDQILDSATTVNFASPLTNLSGTATTANITKVVTFTKDTNKPVVSSYVIEKDVTTGAEYLVVTFDKNVQLAGLATANCVTDSTYTKNYITTGFTTVAPGASNVTFKDSFASKKVVRVPLASLLALTDVEDAVYSAKVHFVGVTSEAAIAPDDVTFAFTRGNDTPGSIGTELKVNSITASATDNNKIDVVFSRAVDGASATTASNYTVQGASVQSVILTSTTTATINLVQDSNPNTGDVNVSVANVLTYDKLRTVTPITLAVAVVENVRPTVTKAELTDLSTITLTFSENVANLATTDFEVYVAGTKVAASNTIVAGKTVTITLGTPLTVTDLAAVIEVKPSTTIAVTDASVPANKLNFTSIVVAK